MDEHQPLKPWWERWSGWWAEQQFQLKLICPNGRFLSTGLSQHEQRWEGECEAAGRRWPLSIVWSMGTPWSWPRFFSPAVGVCLHQFNDGSLCLSPPDSIEQGWSGMVDIHIWLDRVKAWFTGYLREGWEQNPLIAWVGALQRPAPGYRGEAAPEPRLLLPRGWERFRAGQLGRFTAHFSISPVDKDTQKLNTLPQKQRFGAESPLELGMVTDCRDTRGRQMADASMPPDLLDGEVEAFEGIWCVYPSPTSRKGSAALSRVFHERSQQREFDRLLEKVVKRSLQSGRPALHLFRAEMPDAVGASFWLAQPVETRSDSSMPKRPSDGVGEQVLSLADRIAQQISNAANKIQEALSQPSIATELLTAERLNSRRRAGRTDNMQTQLSKRQVMIVGLGALGSQVAQLLAQEGVGRFILVDRDILNAENLARHAAGLELVGRHKVEAVRRLILRTNPLADIKECANWLDSEVAKLSTNVMGQVQLVIGTTAEEGMECLLDELCQHHRIPALHGWLEVQGQVLRLLRVSPGIDRSLVDLERHSSEFGPGLPRSEQPLLPAACADTVLPGAASAIHGAANMVAQIALELLTEGPGPSNHWLYAPCGVKGVKLPPELQVLTKRCGLWEGNTSASA